MRSLPVMLQSDEGDCGAACLAIVASAAGVAVTVDDARALVGGGSDGTSMLQIAKAAETLGVPLAGYRAGGLRAVPAGSILHWRGTHFVVLDRVASRYVVIVDPAVGRRRVPRAEADQQFAGTVLVPPPGPRRRAERERSLRHIRGALRAHAGKVGLALAVSLVAEVLTIGVARLIAAELDGASGAPSRRLLLAIAAAGFAVVHAVRYVALGRLRLVLDEHLVGGFVRGLLSLPYSFFTTRSSGDLSQRLASVQLVQESFSTVYLVSIAEGAVAAATVVYLAATALPAAIVAVSLLAAAIAIVWFATDRLGELATEVIHARARANTVVHQALLGIEDVKALGSEELVEGLWRDRFLVEMVAVRHRNVRQGAVDGALDSMVTFAPALAILITGVWIAASPGERAAAGLLAGMVVAPGVSVTRRWLQWRLARGYVTRVNEVLDRAATVPDAPIRENSGGLSAYELAVVGASYAPTPMAPPVLRNATLEIRTGETVAVIGRSGAGKSTLLRIAAGLVEPSTGHLETAPGAVIGYVPQRAAMLPGTIAENIALGPAPLAAVRAAARLAEIDDEIMAMPRAYETYSDDLARRLSGGQLQRLVLARALFRNPSVLVLDEPTSGVDPATEARIFANLTGRTVLVAAHRREVLKWADRVVTMEQGRICDEGLRRDDRASADGFFEDSVP